MNELYQQNVIKESHCHFQEIDLFSSFYGGISSDPIRGIRNLHQLFPAAVLQQQLIRESVSGRQAYNIYLGKHNVGQNVKITQGSIPLPKPNTVNHFRLSNSSWYKKACVPLIFSGVIVNFIKLHLKIFKEYQRWFFVAISPWLSLLQLYLTRKQSRLVPAYTKRVYLEFYLQ